MAWASEAGLLVANLSQRWVEGTDCEYSEFSLYDLGQAVAHMTIQAEALGLASRQFRGFDREALTAEFTVPDHWQIVSMTAVGRAHQEPDWDPERPEGPPGRSRRPVNDLRWPGGSRH